MTTLLIARHGNTFGPGDVVRRAGARTDLPLVPSGLEQGLRLGAYLKSRALVPDRVFTSRLKRTTQTAEKILEALGADAPVEPLALFDEIDYGPDEGRPEEEVKARLGPETLKAWEEKCAVPPGWRADPAALRRGWTEFAARVAREFARKTVLVVTSAGVARFAPAITGKFDTFQADHKLKLATGALCRFVFQDDAWSCLDWNLKP